MKEKSIEQSRQSQVPQFKRLVRVITSDEEFERELRQAGEALVVVDFTTEWWVIYKTVLCSLLPTQIYNAFFHLPYWNNFYIHRNDVIMCQ